MRKERTHHIQDYTEIYNVTGHYACTCFTLPLEFDSLYSQVRMLGTECGYSTACVFKISISYITVSKLIRIV